MIEQNEVDHSIKAKVTPIIYGRGHYVTAPYFRFSISAHTIVKNNLDKITLVIYS